jgi:hypothetical protein
MALPSPSLVPSLLPTLWWRPTLGVLVAALGVLVLSAGMEQRLVPAVHGNSLPSGQQASEERTVLIMPSGPADGVARRRWGSDWVKWEDQGPARLREPRRPADCLGVDLARGRRAESAHLATVALPRPGECGDLREVLTAMALAHHGGSRIRAYPCVLTGFACQSPSQADSDDRIATALFAPALLESTVPLGPPRDAPARCCVVINGTARQAWASVGEVDCGYS